MPIPVIIEGSPAVALWYVDAEERIRRQVQRVPALTLDDNTDSPQVLRVSSAFLFDIAGLEQLAAQQNVALIDPLSQQVAAIVGPSDPSLELGQRLPPKSSLRRIEPSDLALYNDKLRRRTVPTLAKVEPENAAQLEAQLYGGSYKGITDLVTKWLWPRPARTWVKHCAARNITPNQVTLFGALLVLLALWLFSIGQFAAGLAAGWLMTFLDTVDGKLARVTVQSSAIGNVLDHGMDIIHPPFWYIAWGYGLGANAGAVAHWSQQELIALIVGGYVAGRLVEAAFHALGNCGIFSWRPFDAYFRLITGRRNPCMILLTLSVMFGRPDLGLFWVVWWTLISTAILVLRLGYAAGSRVTHGPLHSWLEDADQAANRYPRAFATFSATRAAYGEARATTDA